MPDIPIYTAGGVAGLFLILVLVERRFPLRPPMRALLPRLALNLVFSALAFLTAALVVRPAGASWLQWADERAFGFLHFPFIPEGARPLLGFLLMDLSFYYWHVLNHRVPLLWRFHNVHHLDPDLDVSTGFRFHFGEVVLSAAFRVVQVTAIGLSAWTYLAYELAFQANTLFHHSNVRLPIGIERALSWVLVTPRMHGIHHSQVRGETNSNYSVVFSWWDRLHRSIGLDIPQANLVIGVPGYARPEDNRFWSLVLAPFRAQRDYWRAPDGTVPPPETRSRRDRRHRLAE
ncbi:MAG: sterol desaturase family protein [Candidatus Tectomicrobia bacterium]|uniref:Sterol desaturase family protein n=1 Tax=Tectimicrobiota bacterium TaxID=2528274 RepID=A0A932I4Q3_UNCTE|nr:sterol desaturase family protein [Candidatus Tectomicrobia bacterium]